jgi:hypothetical protein
MGAGLVAAPWDAPERGGGRVAAGAAAGAGGLDGLDGRARGYDEIRIRSGWKIRSVYLRQQPTLLRRMGIDRVLETGSVSRPDFRLL